MNPDELKLRYLLWIRHQTPDCILYGDDGEMQCSRCMIDFKRFSPTEIEDIFQKINFKAVLNAATNKEQQ